MVKYLHVPLSDKGHEIVREIKFLLNFKNKADAVERALQIAIEQLQKETAK